MCFQIDEPECQKNKCKIIWQIEKSVALLQCQNFHYSLSIPLGRG